MKKNYGNSFNTSKAEVEFGFVSLFPMVDEFHPVGAYIAAGGDIALGERIKAGTPVAIDVIGGEPTLNGDAPIGLVYEDAYMGTDGCTVTIVTRGQVNESLYEGTYSAAQKAALNGRILFIKEA